jgi:dipeptidyl-peptidase-3
LDTAFAGDTIAFRCRGFPGFIARERSSSMKRIIILAAILSIVALVAACKKSQPEPQTPTQAEAFQWKVDQFADVKILRYQVKDFENLTLAQKELIYYLSQAALCGRDITFAQNYRHNLVIRKTLDAIVEGYQGDRNDPQWQAFMVYVKQVWYANGIHHDYASEKFVPGFDADYFATLVKGSEGVKFPLSEGQTLDGLLAFLKPILFDPNVDAKKVSLDSSQDLVKSSAVNFYEGVTQAEAESFYGAMGKKGDPTPVSYGLNSRLVKKGGRIVEEVYSIDGLYGPAIAKIVFWLEKAAGVAENDRQKKVIEKLIEYYRSGDLRTFDEYNILWLADTQSRIDFINGFIEVYEDPLGRKGIWEANVNFKDLEATKRADTISANAQWFEDNSPVDPRFKKKVVKGVSAKVITAAMLGGDSYPATPIGINLPNANWIRSQHGSKSVTLENITYANSQSALQSGFAPEFCSSPEELERSRTYAAFAGNMHTDLHEVLGHGSGQLLPGVSSDSLKNYHSTIEEARADLFALYYIMDPKMLELELLPSAESAKAEYDTGIRNGLLTQMVRIQPGKTIEEAHMRSRALVSQWVYEKGLPEKVIAKEMRDGKTYFVIQDYQKLRVLYGQLLAEVQRITSEGDFAAAKALVETYGVKIDPVLHKEALERYAKLKLAPYTGFLNVVYVPVEKDGKIVDIKIEYPTDYVQQMLRYGKEFSFL